MIPRTSRGHYLFQLTAPLREPTNGELRFVDKRLPFQLTAPLREPTAVVVNVRMPESPFQLTAPLREPTGLSPYIS